MEKIAVVTGTSSGIGFETSLALAREGYYTYATMRDTTKSDKIQESLVLTKEFVKSTYESVAKIAHSGGDLKEAMQACREFCDEKFAKYAIYEHCLPFNVSRAFDEAKGIDNPRIWTAERDKEMWNLLQ